MSVCAKHPAVEATGTCGQCSSPVCPACSFPQPNNMLLCPDCAVRAQARPARRLDEQRITQLMGMFQSKTTGELKKVWYEDNRAVWSDEAFEAIHRVLNTRGESLPEATVEAASGKPGVKCLRHPEVMAVLFCSICGAPVCATCDFSLPGDIHACPDCVSRPSETLSSKRRKSLVWSYALAVLSSIGLVLMLLISILGSGHGEIPAEALGMMFSILVLIPSIIGTALGISCFERRLKNPLAVWGAVVWNGLMLGIYILMAIIGSFM
jgi:hypothetical protein